MIVRFWGTRGSIAVPGPSTVRYGGNTACVQLTTRAGTHIILDCGTGARELGLSLLANHKPPFKASILLSHTHWDHIQGIPFFIPFYLEGNEFAFYAARGMNKQVNELLAGQMEDSYFPVRLDHLRASMSFHEVGEKPFQVGDAVVQPLYVNHTTICLGYRIMADGASMVYVTDHEPYTLLPLSPGGEVLHSGDLSLIAFAKDADLLIHDAQYTDEEYPSKVGWGHSTARYAASIAVAAGVKHLMLFHHEPAHGDSDIDRQVQFARDLTAGLAGAPWIEAAYEGQELTLEGTTAATVRPDGAEPGELKPTHVPRILIADDDRLIALMIQDALREDGYELITARDGEQALSLALSRQPDLVILDVEMPKATGFDVCGRLREDPNMASVPIIMLTSLDDPKHIAYGFEQGASDYLTKPFTRAVLQARVRSWLVKSGML